MTVGKRPEIVLMGLVGLVAACKDEASDAPAEVEAAGASNPETKTGESKDAAQAPPAPAEPLPTGHAVAKVGSLLFFSSTGDVGFELPPLGSAAGVTIDVVGQQDGRLVVETLVTEPAEHHCAASLDGLADFRLRLYLAEGDLLPVLIKELEHSFGDGTTVRVSPGVPMSAKGTELVARGTAVRVPVPAERLGRSYTPAPPMSQAGSAGLLYPLAGHSLAYDGRTLDEADLYEMGGSVQSFGVDERTRDALVTVRNPCLEATVLVSLERLRTPPPMPGIFAGFMEEPEPSPYDLAAMVEGGMAGPGPTTKVHAVRSGTAIVWTDGRPAGQVTVDHAFETPPRDEGGRSCFDVPLVVGQATTVALCFAPGDVSELEVPAKATEAALAPEEPSGMFGLLAPIDEGGVGFGAPSGGSGVGGSSRKPPKVASKKLEAKGSLDKDIIRRIVRAHISEVRFCYNRGLSKDPSLRGKVSIRFDIAPSGSVPVAVVADDTLADESVGHCIAKAVKRWTFPKPEGGTVVVTYPFVLEPGE